MAFYRIICGGAGEIEDKLNEWEGKYSVDVKAFRLDHINEWQDSGYVMVAKLETKGEIDEH